ncbi:MAG: hypothetical protein V2A73_21795 [Pseudomonadota bacterium]
MIATTGAAAASAAVPVPAPAPAPATTQQPADSSAGTGGPDAEVSQDDSLDPSAIHLPTSRKRFSLNAGFAVSFVSGPLNPGTTVETNSGTRDFSSTYNPAFDFGLSLGATLRLSKHSAASLAYSLSRELHFCDTCETGYDPNNGGSDSSLIVRTSDLRLGLARQNLYRIELLGMTVGAAMTATVPASRDSLFCNPMFGVLAGSVSVSRQQSSGIGIGTTLSATRSFYKYAAPPVGNPGCSPDLRGATEVETLTGPTPVSSYQGSRFASDSPNAKWAANLTLTLGNPHALIRRLSAEAAANRHFQRLSSSLSLGVSGRLVRQGESTTLDEAILGPPLEIPAAHTTPVLSFPVSATVGYRLSQRLLASLTIANSVPQLLYDPEAYYQSLPYQATVSAGIAGSY